MVEEFYVIVDSGWCNYFYEIGCFVGCEGIFYGLIRFCVDM